MVQRTVVLDDLDKSTPDATTVRFALNGIAYEIDLAEENKKRLDDFLAEFIDAGQKVGVVQVVEPKKDRRPRLSRPATPVPPPTASNGAGNGGAHSKVDSTTIRAWAKSRGIEVGDKGRVPKRITDQYETEHGGVTGSPPAPPKKTALRATKAAKASGGTRGRKSAVPPTDELTGVLKQLGYDQRAAAAHFAEQTGVSVATALRWVKEAHEILDPVT